MTKILFPTDLTHRSREAFEWSVEFAKTNRFSIQVFRSFSGAGRTAPQFLTKKSNSTDLDKLRQFAELHGRNQPRVTYKATEGRAADKIIEAEATNEYGLVVMNKKAVYHRMDRWWGTCTSQVAARSHTPVLVLPPGLEFKHFRNILISMGDYEEVGSSYRQFGIRLAQYYNAHLHEVKVVKPSAGWKQSMRPIPGVQTIHHSLEIPHTNIADTLIEYAASHQIDLIIQLTRPRSQWYRWIRESFTEKMIFATPIPLLILKTNFVDTQDLSYFTPDKMTILDPKQRSKYAGMVG